MRRSVNRQPRGQHRAAGPSVRSRNPLERHLEKNELNRSRLASLKFSVQYLLQQAVPKKDRIGWYNPAESENLLYPPNSRSMSGCDLEGSPVVGSRNTELSELFILTSRVTNATRAGAHEGLIGHGSTNGLSLFGRPLLHSTRRVSGSIIGSEKSALSYYNTCCRQVRSPVVTFQGFTVGSCALVRGKLCRADDS